jgi:REP element-mobilizing transposase RayT
MLPDHYLQFFTATILEWKHLLTPKKYKDILASSLSFLVQDNRIIVYGFVIISNHIHLVWQIQPGYKPENTG